MYRQVVQTSLLVKLAQFAVVGLVATLLQYAILIIAVQLLALSPVIGSGIGFVLSAALNYYLNRRFTFQSGRPHRSAACRFALIACTGLVINLLLMQWLAVRLAVPYLLAQVAVTLTVLLWNFTGSLLWSFAPLDSKLQRPVARGSGG